MNKLEKKLYRVSCPPKKIVYTGVNRQYTGLFKPEILGTPCIYISIYVYICMYM